MVSGNFFSGLGVRMLWASGFKMEDEQRHSPFVVLSFALLDATSMAQTLGCWGRRSTSKAFRSQFSGSRLRDFRASKRASRRTSGFRCRAVLN